jgi:hypothetical protein
MAAADGSQLTLVFIEGFRFAGVVVEPEDNWRQWVCSQARFSDSFASAVFALPWRLHAITQFTKHQASKRCIMGYGYDYDGNRRHDSSRMSADCYNYDRRGSFSGGSATSSNPRSYDTADGRGSYDYQGQGAAYNGHRNGPGDYYQARSGGYDDRRYSQDYTSHHGYDSGYGQASTQQTSDYGNGSRSSYGFSSSGNSYDRHGQGRSSNEARGYGGSSNGGSLDERSRGYDGGLRTAVLAAK